MKQLVCTSKYKNHIVTWYKQSTKQYNTGANQILCSYGFFIQRKKLLYLLKKQTI